MRQISLLLMNGNLNSETLAAPDELVNPRISRGRFRDSVDDSGTIARETRSRALRYFDSLKRSDRYRDDATEDQDCVDRCGSECARCTLVGGAQVAGGVDDSRYEEQR